ncbi:MAG: DUF4349 domain-containing protein [Myxococcota bacterium]|nr:DUF4349 domain-containing protein [Myxococcota bacterium]
MNRILFYLILLFTMNACSGKQYAKSYGDHAYEQQAVAMDFQSKGYIGEGAPAMKSEARYKKKMAVKERGKQSSQQEPISRRIHYNGHVELQVARVEESMQEILRVAKENGGALENRGEKYITIRVPQQKFDAVFETLLSLGEVISKSITAQDLSQAFQATSLRLRTATSTRDRLLELLNKSQDEKEKIALLKEIQRLNEQIDTIESQLRILDNLSKMSRITVELRPRQNQVTSRGQEATGFSWIQDLSPFQSDVLDAGKRYQLPIPEGMVLLSKRGLFKTQSANGSFLRAATLPNQPQGSAAFWQKAIHKRLADGFASANLMTLGAYQAVSFLSDSQKPYTYIVAVHTEERKLHVVEIYYPTPEQNERYHKSIKAIMGGK